MAAANLPPDEPEIDGVVNFLNDLVSDIFRSFFLKLIECDFLASFSAWMTQMRYTFSVMPKTC